MKGIRGIVSRMMRMVGMRTCEEVVNVLSDYLEGTLDPELAAIITRHLQDCPDCDAFMRTYAATVRMTGELTTEEIPEALRQRVRYALEERYGR